MAELLPEVVRLGGYVPAAPMAVIEILITIAGVSDEPYVRYNIVTV